MRARAVRTSAAVATLAAIAVGLAACGQVLEPAEAAAALDADLTGRLADLTGGRAEVDVAASLDDPVSLVDVDVVFPADASGEELVRAAAAVRSEVLAPTDAEGGLQVELRSLSLGHEGGNGHSARWYGETLGADVEAEAELWARMVDSLGVEAVHVWHDEGERLTVEALGPGSDVAPSSGAVYDDTVALVEAAGLELDEIELLVWTDYALSSSSTDPLPDDLVTALDEVRGLPVLADVQVEAAPGSVEVVAWAAFVEGTADRVPFGDAERDELVGVLRDAGVLTDGLVVEVVGMDGFEESTRVWPLS